MIQDDPLGCRERLRRGLADPAVPGAGEAATAAGRAAAFAVAAAVGRCVLFDVWPRPARGSLPSHLAAAAAAELADRLHVLSLVRPTTVAEAAAVIHRRVDAWAAYVAIEEAAGETADLRPVLDAADACDAALEAAAPLMAAAGGDPRVRRVRAALAPPHRELPPWWLGGGG